MKILVSLVFVFILNLRQANAQLILNNKDTSLARYLEKTIKFIDIDDTCFVGIFNISFSLTKESKVIDYDYSKNLSLNVANKIKALIISLENSWDSSFVKNSVGKRIVQPLFMYIQNNCTPQKQKNQFILKNKNNPDIELQKNMEHLNALYNLADLLVISQSTFSQSNNYFFSGKNDAELCVLLNSALIINERRVNRQIKKL
jgi:hypothetical protein